MKTAERRQKRYIRHRPGMNHVRLNLTVYSLQILAQRGKIAPPRRPLPALPKHLVDFDRDWAVFYLAQTPLQPQTVDLMLRFRQCG